MTQAPLLIGYGSWGRKVAAKLVSMGVPPCAIIDPVAKGDYAFPKADDPLPPVAERSIARWAAYGGRASCAIVCTPPYHGRLRIVSELAALGIEQVHLAKPACVDLEELDELLALVDCGMNITVGHTTLYGDRVECIRQFIGTGDEVDVYMTRSTRSHPAHGGSPIVDLASHDIALLMETVGVITGIESAHCDGKSYDVVVRAGHVRAVLQGGWDDPEPQREIAIHDGNSYLVIDDHTFKPHPLDPLEKELADALYGNGYALRNAALVVRAIEAVEFLAANTTAEVA